MKPKQTAIILAAALLATGGYAVYNQTKVSEQKKKITSLVSEVNHLQQSKQELEEKVGELEEQIEELQDNLSNVQHFDDNASVGTGYSSTKSGSVSFTGSVYETQIDGTFEGWDGDTIFKMMDGSIWQQASYDYTYHYAYMPKVIIYNKGDATYMKVEDVDDPIQVKRLQ